MIILGLGSNLPSSFGNRFDNINFAILALAKCGFKVKKKSKFYETPSYPDKKKPKFINIVANVKTDLTPEELVSALISVEETLERKRGKKNDPRTCDIDLIDYNGKILNINYKNHIFDVPHKKLIYRNFVLYPIKEINPMWRHPESNEHIDKLIEKLSNEDKKSILKVKKS
jgi:2-amino-4-hydroxy-6-hydroxymethyldihydropteridine diphosphokinase